MEWLVLKNRRHEGPYTEPELREALRSGRVLVDDYVISLRQAEAGDLNYTPLRKVLGLPEESWEPRRSAAKNVEATKVASVEAAVSKSSQDQVPLDPALLAKLESADFVPGISESRKVSSMAEAAMVVENTPAPPRSTQRPWWIGGLVVAGLVAFTFVNKKDFSSNSKEKNKSSSEVMASKTNSPSPKATPGGLKPIAKDRPGSRRDLHVPEPSRASDNRASEAILDAASEIPGPEPASLPPADGEMPTAEGASQVNLTPNANIGNAEAVQNPGQQSGAPGFAPYGGYDPQQVQLMQQQQMMQMQQQQQQMPAASGQAPAYQGN